MTVMTYSEASKAMLQFGDGSLLKGCQAMQKKIQVAGEEFEDEWDYEEWSDSWAYEIEAYNIVMHGMKKLFFG